MRTTIVIPAYNEALRLPRSLPRLIAFLKGRGAENYEIVISDDGSTDRTSELAEGILRESGIAFQVIRAEKNQGRGGAVRTGVLAARGEYVVETDADGSVDEEAIGRFESYLIEHPDVDLIVGSRGCADAQILTPQPLLRVVLGEGFIALCRMAIDRRISDFSLGFKMFRRRAIEPIFSVQRDNRFFAEAEIIFISRVRDLCYVELPVLWTDYRDSRVRPFRDVPRTLNGLFTMLRRHLRGEYRLNADVPTDAPHSTFDIRHSTSIIAKWGCALLVSLLIGMPSVLFRFDPNYRGVDFFGSDAEESYVTQIRKVYDGQWNLGNPFLYEYRDAPYVQQPLSPGIVALIARATGRSVADANIVTKFIFPFLLFFILWAFFFELTGRRSLAYLGALFILMTPATTILLDPSSILSFLRDGPFANAELQFLSYARPINPQISSLFFFGTLLCLWRFAFRDSRTRAHGIAASVLLGLSFYTYFFAYSLLFALTFFLGLWFTIRRDWNKAKRIIAIVVGALVIGIPYLLNAFAASQSPFALTTAAHLGQVFTHAFVFSRVWWGLLVVTLLISSRSSKAFRAFCLSFLGAAFVVTNQQILTGRTAPIPSHYHWYYVAPIGGVLFFLLALNWIQSKWPRTHRATNMLASGLTVSFLVLGFLFQYRTVQSLYPSFIERQRYGDVLRWLETSTSSPEVIFGTDLMNLLIPAYTKHYVYYNGYAGDYLIDPARKREGVYLYHRLEGVTPEQLRAQMKTPDGRDRIGNQLFGQTYRAQNGCYGCFPDAVAENIAQGYEAFLKTPLPEILKRQRLDAVIRDTQKDPAWNFDGLLKDPTYSKDGIEVYPVIQ